jgi:hypothetical protein
MHRFGILATPSGKSAVAVKFFAVHPPINNHGSGSTDQM